jgi:hypothetical protein
MLSTNRFLRRLFLAYRTFSSGWPSNPQYCDENELNNCIQIRGIPTKAGIAKVRIHGGLGGGMLSKSGEFDKTYTITIKDSEGSS